MQQPGSATPGYAAIRICNTWDLQHHTSSPPACPLIPPHQPLMTPHKAPPAQAPYMLHTSTPSPPRVSCCSMEPHKLRPLSRSTLPHAPRRPGLPLRHGLSGAPSARVAAAGAVVAGGPPRGPASGGARPPAGVV
eukprot:364648-Chlamydomonas_euryale.AAC.1